MLPRAHLPSVTSHEPLETGRSGSVTQSTPTPCNHTSLYALGETGRSGSIPSTLCNITQAFMPWGRREGQGALPRAHLPPVTSHKPLCPERDAGRSGSVTRERYPEHTSTSLAFLPWGRQTSDSVTQSTPTLCNITSLSALGETGRSGSVTQSTPTLCKIT